MPKTQVKVNAMSFALLIKEMLGQSYTCAELAERTGLHYVTVLNYTRELHKARAAHICAWRMNDQKQYVLKVYGIGHMYDASKPRKAKTPAERQIKYRAKLKREKEREQQSANKQRDGRDLRLLPAHTKDFELA